MKKFLLCMMLAGLMMPVVAQVKSPFGINGRKSIHVSETTVDLGISDTNMLPVNTRGTLIDAGGWKAAGTSDRYDRQSQGSVYPMTKVHSDGFIGTTWTNEDCPPFEGSSVKNRGVAYTFSKDGGKTWAEPDLRVGGIPLFWASYAQWGPKGEAILARSADEYEYEDMQIVNGLMLLTREVKGVGKWTMRAVPYPEGTPYGTPDEYVMAWSRMVTSGENHEYIQILTHTRGKEGTLYEGYYQPVFYFRTSDGGETWEVPGKLVPDEVAGMEWDKIEDAGYTDKISFVASGNTIACSFVSFGFHSYAMKSTDNGDTWEATKFFNANVRYYGDPEEYPDTCYIPTHAAMALDNNGKMHIAFGNRMASNGDEEGSFWVYSGWGTSFLSYWNEDMDPLDCDSYKRLPIYDLMDEFFIGDDSDERLHIKSTTPEWPIVGFFTPTVDGKFFTMPDDYVWILSSYGRAGMFSFPQMAFDKDNTMHLAYLGILDGGSDGDCWLRHPYYTSRDSDGNWTETEYLVNTINLIDREFAYLTLGGLYDDKMHFTVQVDAYAGTNEPYSGQPADHDPVTNTYYYFNIFPVPTPPVSINEIAPITFNVKPNPASGQVTIDGFEGKGNITVYNMLGQAVYHVENVENTKTIPLNNMASGVYFVTIRSGNATGTQKLIVQ